MKLRRAVVPGFVEVADVDHGADRPRQETRQVEVGAELQVSAVDTCQTQTCQGNLLIDIELLISQHGEGLYLKTQVHE